MQSGLPEFETQRAVYGLALSGVVIREYWQNAFRAEAPKTTKVQTPVAPTITAQSEQSDNWISASVEHEDMEEFLGRLKAATNHYEVLDLPTNAKLTEIKDAYYAMARRYHPDRFHLIKSGTKTHAQISSAFARVTQAYETLTNPNARAGYDATLERARRFAEAEAKVAKAEQTAETSAEADFDANDSETGVGRAEYSFREGCGALDQGRITAAVKYLANAARLEPQEARYRAYYGRALAADGSTRRLAENEIQTAVKLEPANASFRTMLAELYFDLKFHRRAQTELDRALSIDPHNAAANLLLRKLEKSRKVG
jgi:curved DNA-binding protein CbpA